jgi:two-component system, OmpR family, sensor histidine kinase MtrB
VTLFFSIATLTASLALAVVTYAVARNYLLDQRTSVARSQSFSNANAIRAELRAQARPSASTTGTSNSESAQRDLSSYIQQLPEVGGFAILVPAIGDPIFTDQAFRIAVLPDDLVTNVENEQYGMQRFNANDDPYLGVGIYIAEFDMGYFEAYPLAETDRSLQAIATALLLGAGVTALMAAAIGWWTNRRLLRPLTRVARAAGNIASGGLDTRMPAEADPDLARLANSFNEMADAVQTRLEREARFASDVSHELRSPITALSAAVEVLDARRNELPERTQQALDVVVTQVRRFDQMVMDLLELSRIDAGSTDLHREDVQIAELISRIAHRYGFGDVPIEIGRKVPTTVRIDKLRFERILANLLDNANQHGGGPTRVALEPRGRNGIVLAVEDAGPGVARGERARIFERFARGSAARHKIGTGLGLSLVAEHAHAHRGEAWVEDRPGGGARFIVTFNDTSGPEPAAGAPPSLASIGAGSLVNSSDITNGRRGRS